MRKVQFPILYSRSSKGAVQTWQIEVEDNKYRTIAGQINGKLTTSTWTACEGKSSGKANATTAEQQAELEALSKFNKQLNKGYFQNVEDIDKVQFIEPMLAKKYEDYKDEVAEVLKNGGSLFSSEKLDGSRNVTSSRGMFSRNGKPWVSAPHIYEALKPVFDIFSDIVFDGELYADKFYNDFNAIISLVKKTKPTPEDLLASANSIEYHIYDIVDTKTNYIDRLNRLKSIKQDFKLPDFIKIVDAKPITDVSQIEQFHDEYVQKGYEGQMIRFNVPYENKRTKYLLKHKHFQTNEYKIVDIKEGIGNRTGVAGFITVDLGNNTTNDASIKGTFAYCKELLINKANYIGKTATVKYFNVTPAGFLRFPVVIDIGREDYE